MKKRTVLAGLLTLALTCTLAACKKEAPLPEPTPSPTPAPTVTPTPTPEPTPTPAAPPVWGDQVFSNTFRAGDGAEVLRVSYALPLVQNTDACPAGSVINDWYKAEGASRMEEAEENYETAVADYDVSKATGLPFSPTSESMTSQVSYEDEETISVRREWYVDYGGAHPWVFLLSEQFDAQTGRQLSFADFFTDADAVRDRAVDAFMADYDLQQAGVSRDQVTVAYQPEHFYLTEEGYVFWISGNVLPAVNSPIEVTLTYDAMKDVSIHG